MKAEPLVTEPKFLDIHETKRMYGLSRSTLYRLLARGEIEAVKVGASTRFSVPSLNQFFATRPKATA